MDNVSFFLKKLASDHKVATPNYVIWECKSGVHAFAARKFTGKEVTFLDTVALVELLKTEAAVKDAEWKEKKAKKATEESGIRNKEKEKLNLLLKAFSDPEKEKQK